MSQRETIADVRLAEAVRQGWLTLPAGRVDPVPRGPAVAPLDKILEELARDREDR